MNITKIGWVVDLYQMKRFLTLPVYLGDYVYEKIWSESSKQDQDVMRAISKTESRKVEDIRKTIHMESNSFSVYRNRLKKKGLITSPAYGHVEFTLPRFSEYVRNK